MKTFNEILENEAVKLHETSILSLLDSSYYVVVIEDPYGWVVVDDDYQLPKYCHFEISEGDVYLKYDSPIDIGRWYRCHIIKDEVATEFYTDYIEDNGNIEAFINMVQDSGQLFPMDTRHIDLDDMYILYRGEMVSNAISFNDYYISEYDEIEELAYKFHETDADEIETGHVNLTIIGY